MKNKLSYGNMDFIKIPSGSFMMGMIEKDEFANPIETTRKIRITHSFFIQTTPVTIKQYMEFLNETSYEKEYLIEIWDGNKWIEKLPFSTILARGDNYPIVGVSYIDAQNYINWLSKKYNKKFRLPTEAEFEYAAKSNCQCKTKCFYSQEVKEKNLARMENSPPANGARMVKTGIKTKQGLYDMHGLIWQWCSDWFFYYDNNEVNDPKGPIDRPDFAPWKGEKWFPGKVIRGGSFSYPYNYSRCSNRHYSKISDRNYNLGFRICFDEE